MKKILLLTIFFILTTAIAFPQITIKAGPSLATFGGDDSKLTLDLSTLEPALTGTLTIEPKTRIGLVGGVAIRISLPFGISLQPELLYVQKGTIYKTPTISLDALFPGLSASAEQTFKLDYIEIPVILRYSLPVPVVDIFLEAGLSYSFLQSAKITTKLSLSGVPGLPAPTIPETDIKSESNKTDFSIQLGGGFAFAMLELDARYVIGMSKLDKDELIKTYNRTFMLTAGIRL